MEAALEEALANRVDAAVDAGRLTEAQGEELKERLRSGDFPLVGVGPGRWPCGGGHLFGLGGRGLPRPDRGGAAREQLRDGRAWRRSPRRGQVRRGPRRRSRQSAKAELADAVEDGKLSDAQQDELEAELTDQVEALRRARALPRAGRPARPGFGHGAAAPNSA